MVRHDYKVVDLEPSRNYMRTQNIDEESGIPF